MKKFLMVFVFIAVFSSQFYINANNLVQDGDIINIDNVKNYSPTIEKYKLSIDYSDDIYTTETINLKGQFDSANPFLLDFSTNGFNVVNYEIFDGSSFEIEISMTQEFGQLTIKALDDINIFDECILYGYKSDNGIFLNDNSIELAIDNYMAYLVSINKKTQIEYDNFVREHQSLNRNNETLISNSIALGTRGFLYWCDDDNIRRPLKGIKVELCVNVGVLTSVIDTTYTNDNGYYCLTDNSTSSLKFVRIHASGYSIAVYKNIFWGTKYYIDSDYLGNSNGGVVMSAIATSNYTFHMYDSDGTISNIGRAMQIAQALIFGERYVNKFNGSYASFVKIQYPDGEDSDAYANSSGLHIGKFQYKCWDVLLHEYGHHLQDEYNLDDSSGGKHYIDGYSLSDKNKEKGIKLTWGEAWPTVFANLVTKYYSNEIDGVKHTNDDFYDSVNDEDIWWSFNIENPSMSKYGEGSEGTIIAVLYDLFDSYSSKETFDNISLDHQEFWNIIIRSKAKTFSDFASYCYLFTFIDENDFGKILAEYGMSVSNISIRNISTDTLPIVSWTKCNSSFGSNDIFCSDKYDIEFLSPTRSIILKVTDVLKTSYTLTQEQWYNIIHYYGTYFYVRVTSYQTYNYKTGGYISEMIKYTKPTNSFVEDLHLYSSTRLIEKNIDIYPNSTAEYNLRVYTSGMKLIQTLGSIDTELYLYDENMNQIKSNDDDGYNTNALLYINLESNINYKLIVKTHNINNSGKTRLIITPAYSVAKEGKNIDRYNNIMNFPGGNWDFYSYAQQHWTKILTYTPEQTGKHSIELECVFDSYLYVLDPRSPDSILLNNESDDDSGTNFASKLIKDLNQGIPYLIIYSQYNITSEFINLDEGDDCKVMFRKI
ncbi:MAG: hypothetical protein J1F31_06880 [Erysipelotrichales bacterium]|nr:hypothetical protein [Erysipelotrichales bacterium]